VYRTIDGTTRRVVSILGSLRSEATGAGRRRDPRAVVLGTAALAVLAGAVVGTAARWPLAGVVLAFVLVGTVAVVYAAPDVLGRVFDRLRALSDGLGGGVRSRWSVTRSAPASTAEPDAGSAERLLRDAGLVVDDGENVPRVARDFESAWRRRIVSIGARDADASTLASLLDVPAGEVDLRWRPNDASLVAYVEGRRAGSWPSRAAFVADVTAVAEFRSSFPRWWSLSPAMRTNVLAALRLGLRWCPVCDGSLAVARRAGLGDDAPVLASTCRACDARLFEAPLGDATFESPNASTDADAGL
jgi:hypothetical protein